MTTDSTAFADPGAFERAAGLLEEADRITVLTGAGVSTDSGIPDFRGPHGVWTTDPDAQAQADITLYTGDVDVRRQVWSQRRAHQVWDAEPNAAHRALADLERTGRLRALITQNIDGLHQRGGVSAERVVEVHGTMLWVRCLSCGRRTPTPEVLARLDEESDPRCADCGGIQKSDTVSFGQNLDPDVVQAATRATRDCDVFLAVGTSLTVHPVAGLCDMAMMAGASLVVVNGEETPYDDFASAVLHEPIGRALPALVERVTAAARRAGP
ncbi:NAD-dependent deacetylase [Nocardiopsis flavescens]|uniref:protein acetyllysine N-acetyltransferase n=1 Tax=Nocardiopsis flavescens TaxID=758803 RepID=A0A1M6H9P6_9ACTN|nr:Sir2 family NAD-dependent protein deacetylase [Nocardiopsis flavescens]SHJ18942.1 NAD-dependent deacetylase [Nocardiopsis flavescens]